MQSHSSDGHTVLDQTSLVADRVWLNLAMNPHQHRGVGPYVFQMLPRQHHA